jgi:hypothetical protein
MRTELKGKQPIKEISNFLKHLQDTIPKESRIRKNVKKHTGKLPKFF